MHPFPIYSFIAIVLFSLVHLFAAQAKKLNVNVQKGLLSMGSGIALAYVFIDLLPKLSKHETIVKGALERFFPYLERHVYILALLGFLLFFLVDRLKNLEIRDSTYFYLSIGSYALLNFLIGYAVADKDNPEVQPLILFTIAMTLHYFMTDYSLDAEHGAAYDKFARWFLISCLFAGWLTGLTFELSATAVALISAFIGGGVIMNVTRHELPTEHLNSLSVFLLSTIAYTVILLTIG